MGSRSGESDENPVHSVTLSAFNMGKYEVTQVQWKAVMGNNLSNFAGCRDWRGVGNFRMVNPIGANNHSPVSDYLKSKVEI